MRRLFQLVMVLALVLPVTAASAASLSDKPNSVGLGIGLSTFDEWASFALEIPYEYTFKAGPGELALHLGFLLGAREGAVSIGLPFGARYKFHITKYPLYVGPTFDIGPVFMVGDYAKGTVGGMLRFGGIVSYLVHPNVEMFLQPVGLGAYFNADG
ncbi:MAG: hypothetical protein FJ098_11090, partial [Deltaproteobacteria bacterium]|nr:hypothetical protein [Deltaproteobacteria bacterium]